MASPTSPKAEATEPKSPASPAVSDKATTSPSATSPTSPSTDKPKAASPPPASTDASAGSDASASPTPEAQTAPAAPTAPTPHANPKIAELQTMFPTVELSVIEMVLESVGGSQDRAIESLLQMTDPDFKPDELASARQEEAVRITHSHLNLPILRCLPC